MDTIYLVINNKLQLDVKTESEAFDSVYVKKGVFLIVGKSSNNDTFVKTDINSLTWWGSGLGLTSGNAFALDMIESTKGIADFDVILATFKELYRFYMERENVRTKDLYKEWIERYEPATTPGNWSKRARTTGSYSSFGDKRREPKYTTVTTEYWQLLELPIYEPSDRFQTAEELTEKYLKDIEQWKSKIAAL